MATDMSLGGGSFGAGYTPIRFAPLFSLSGPVRATPAPPATEEQIPQTALPFRYDMNAGGQGGYDGPQREYGPEFQPIGNRSRDEIMQDMKNIGMFFASPLSGIASAMAQNAGIPNPLSGLLSSLQNFFSKNVYGPEQVQLYRGAPVQTAVPSMVFDGGLYSVTPELTPIEQTNALFNNPEFYNAIVAGVPQIAGGDGSGRTPTPNLDALNQDIAAFNQFSTGQWGGGAPGEGGGSFQGSFGSFDTGPWGGGGPGEGGSFSSSFDDASSGAYGYI